MLKPVVPRPVRAARVLPCSLAACGDTDDSPRRTPFDADCSC